MACGHPEANSSRVMVRMISVFSRDLADSLLPRLPCQATSAESGPSENYFCPDPNIVRNELLNYETPACSSQSNNFFFFSNLICKLALVDIKIPYRSLLGLCKIQLFNLLL